ncbi:hypothetical protein EW145_g1206 [Phellinidium pouzarii]|uniref:Cleavage/polyadenylation specificity factor A subunit C-terminal domain-containing protein n=1 Tax=Phellinidium pouzarii TaxID=167371 RepID=A0A4S4LFC6_9AGAM|nr:hypothetical protein EW145_g1206 [Phellinidium pouzarii]
MQALRSELLSPSGVEYAASLKLLPSTVNRRHSQDALGIFPKALCNVVTARSNLLRIYEVVEESAPAQLLKAQERGKGGWSRERRDTEAVEGEVEMDTQGEGFVNMGAVKSASSTLPTSTSTLRFYFIREHRLHGIITGVETVKTISTAEDNLDRLLVSFKDAKVALLEWSIPVHDLITVSIHTYERAPQMAYLDTLAFKSELRVDPSSRCAALLLPRDTLAILPFYQSQADLDLVDLNHSLGREVPYSPSFTLDLLVDVDQRVRNVVDFLFLPGFNNPTVAVLFQTQQTWTGRLKEYKDTCHLFIFTLDLVTRKYPIIISVENLPHDCFSIIPCTSSLGGVVILSCNALIYIDPASRKTVLPVNGWAARISDIPMQGLRKDEQEQDLHLEGARAAFVDERTFFLITRDGLIFPVEVIMDGRIVTRLSLGPAMSRTTIPSFARSLSFSGSGGDEAIQGDVLFLGSTVGPSVLLKATRVEEEIVKSESKGDAPAAVVDVPMNIEIDDEDDIYADVVNETQTVAGNVSNGHVSAVETRSVIHLSLCDSLPAYGSIHDMVFALTKNGDRPAAELVAATGHRGLGGFTLFQRDLPTRTKRKLHVVGGARGVWSLPVRQPLRVSGSSADRIRGLPHAPSEIFDTVIVSTDANPSPGSTRFASRTSRNDIAITTRRTETTIGAAPFFQRTAILHVTNDLVRVLEPDCSERQCIKDMDGVVKRPKIRFCSISDPFVLIIREDDTIGLFVGDAERGRIRRKDMTPMGEKVSRYSAGSFFSDKSGVFELYANTTSTNPEASDSKQKSASASLESAVDTQRGTQWLVLCRPQGVVELWTLPKLGLVFSTSIIKDLPAVLSDSFDPPALSVPEDPPRKHSELDVDQLQMAQIGETSPQPHLIVLLRCGQMAIYQATAIEKPDWPVSTSRTATLQLNFVKRGYRTFEPRPTEVTEKSSLISEQRRALRSLISFTTSPTPESALSGVFVTGDQPIWIIGTDKEGLRIHSCGYQVVNSFTACSIWDSRGDFLMHTDEGPCLLEWMPNVNLGTNMPSRSVPQPRTYTNVAFDAATGLMVVASQLDNPFTIFDEDGNKMWEPDAPNVNYPLSEMSTIELFPSDFSCIMDGFEFQPNEFVNALDCVSLETQSTESGMKEFVVVGTTINRGEDLAVKGATYVFDIVEVVPDPEKAPMRCFKLRMLCRDEAKGPVTALCGMNGYLVSSMGQKIFVRALDLDERLVGVAFLDVGVYVTTLRTIKNLLLVGDARKDKGIDQRLLLGGPVQARHPRKGRDEEGVIRFLEYDPSDPETRGGQYLIQRTEFHGQVESRTSALVARRQRGEEGLVPQARLISGATDGSMFALTPVDSEETAKKLQLLQGQLTRNMQHIAGLNPRAFRIVRNDSVSRPLMKGILDGNLLAAFEELPISRQNEITRPIGMERLAVLKEWTAMNGPW